MDVKPTAKSEKSQLRMFSQSLYILRHLKYFLGLPNFFNLSDHIFLLGMKLEKYIVCNHLPGVEPGLDIRVCLLPISGSSH